MTLTQSGSNRLVSLQLARRLAHDWTGFTGINDADQILHVVCDVMSQDPDAVAGVRTFSHVIAARHLWWACLRRYCGWSYPVIGDYVDRDHTTVMRGIANVPTALVESVGPLLEGWHHAPGAA